MFMEKLRKYCPKNPVLLMESVTLNLMGLMLIFIYTIFKRCTLLAEIAILPSGPL